ncbi:MATH domain and coiled-coil domain-containing protein At2g42460 [Eutrema salsugineum]|uniref:MATH domain and coiled-coil domain-containing protein At2g42460 n=1 Tax=Eutrema salsugineum TaxID=72664 RepID=UPI000CECF449|nr:MATH domain and coiled-coil domain-containing protein At2g42460 [Eutrema salsugineum]
MEDQKHTTDFTIEIDNFSQRKTMISSPNFLSGGCEWYVKVLPKGDCINDRHVHIYLCVGNPESLRPGWKIRTRNSFVVLNQSGKELYRLEGFLLDKNKLTLKVQVKVVEVVDEGEVTGNEMLEFKGFQVPYSKVSSLTRLFKDHRNIAKNFREKDQLVKTSYMIDLLDLIETLNKPPYSLSETELRNALRKLMELKEVGFKVNWLKKKHDEIQKRESNKTMISDLNKGTKAIWLDGVVHSWKVRVRGLVMLQVIKTPGKQMFLQIELTVREVELMEYGLRT